MAELKLRKLDRGYILTDFDDHEIGIKDSEQAIEEIKKLLKPDNKPEKPITDGNTLETKPNTVEIHRKIFEKAKEQIESVGKINVAKIARDLGINISTTRGHIIKMNPELETLIKKWKEERDEQAQNVETGTRVDSERLAE